MRILCIPVCLALSSSCGGSPFTPTFGDDGGTGPTAIEPNTAGSPVSPAASSPQAGAATESDGSAASAVGSGHGDASVADQAAVDRASPAVLDSGALAADVTAAQDGSLSDAPASVADATAAQDTSLPDAPPSLAPGMLACGTSVCNEATQFCCVQPSGSESCLSSSDTCSMLGGAQRDCDKASDCPSGKVCCLDFSSVPATTGCDTDCGGGGNTRVQACRTQSECLSGTCSVHACATGGSIESCTPFAPECP